MFIRYWADTTGSQLSYYALEYMRSFMRVAPVRLISVTGVLAGRWQAYGELLATPMTPAFINAVCCDPARWTWHERVPAGSRPVVPVGDHEEVVVPEVTETITGMVELHTAGVRNVLFAVAPPRSAAQLATAKKYDVVVVPSSSHGDGWIKNGIQPRVIGFTTSMPDNQAAIRNEQIKELLFP